VTINWNDPKAKISKYFTVKEATLLPRWGICHQPTETEKAAILRLAAKMDRVREMLAVPISIHVWIRPKKVNCPGSARHGQDYNFEVGGAKASAHTVGSGVDWDAKGMTCDRVREMLKSKLADLGLCMEDTPGSNWVHTDDFPPRGNTGRFFKP
jgi:hypothetical protein